MFCRAARCMSVLALLSEEYIFMIFAILMYNAGDDLPFVLHSLRPRKKASKLTPAQPMCSCCKWKEDSVVHVPHSVLHVPHYELKGNDRKCAITIRTISSNYKNHKTENYRSTCCDPSGLNIFNVVQPTCDACVGCYKETRPILENPPRTASVSHSLANATLL